MIRNQHSRSFFIKHNNGRYFGDREEDYTFTKIFAGENIEASYNQLKAFLRDEGFSYLTIPKDTDELHLVGKNENGIFWETPPISIEQSAYHASVLILRVQNENHPNYLLERGLSSREEQIDLKRHRINEAILFVKGKLDSNGDEVETISPDRLREISRVLLEVNLDKTTILGALLQDGFRHQLYTIEEVANEFGVDVAEAMYDYSFEIF